MSSKFSVAADVSGAISAFRQMQAAIRDAGQESKRLSETRFSASGDLLNMEKDIRKVHKAFEDLRRVSPALQQMEKRQDTRLNAFNWLDVAHKDLKGGALETHVSAVGQRILRDTRFDLRPPPPPPVSPATPPPDQRGDRRAGLETPAGRTIPQLPKRRDPVLAPAAPPEQASASSAPIAKPAPVRGADGRFLPRPKPIPAPEAGAGGGAAPPPPPSGPPSLPPPPGAPGGDDEDGEKRGPYMRAPGETISWKRTADGTASPGTAAEVPTPPPPTKAWSMDDVAAAVRESGQAGMRLGDMDLGHEKLRPFAGDLRRANKAMQHELRHGEGPAASTLRGMARDNGGELDPVSWWSGLERTFGSREKGQRHAEVVGERVLGTTQIGLPPAPPPELSEQGTRAAATLADVAKRLADLGLAGRDVTKLDWKMPGLAKLRQDIPWVDKQLAQAQTNLQEVLRADPTHAGALLRRQAAALPQGEMHLMKWWELNERPQTHQQRRMRDEVGSKVLRDTDLALPAPDLPALQKLDVMLGRTLDRALSKVGGGLPHGGNFGVTGNSAGGGTAEGPIGGIIGKTRIGRMLGGLGLAQLAVSGVGNAQEENENVDRLLKHLNDAGTEFDGLRARVRETGSALHLTSSEAIGLTRTFTEAANERIASRGVEGGLVAGGLARGFGIDSKPVAESLGRARFYGNEDPRRLAELTAETTNRAGMSGQPQEVLGAIVRYIEQAAGRHSHDANPDLFAQAYARLNQQGTRGQHAEHLLERANQGVTNAGQGEDARGHAAFQSLQSLGIVSPWQQEYIREGGAFERVPNPDGTRSGDRPTLIEADIRHVLAGFGRTAQTVELDPAKRMANGDEMSERAIFALGKMLQTGARGAEQMIGMVRDGRLERATPLLERAGLTEDERKAVKGERLEILPEVARLSDDNREALEARRERMLARPDLTPDDVSLLGGKGRPFTGTDDELRAAEARVLARRGLDPNEGRRQQDSIGDMSREFTEALSPLVPTITEAREGLATLARGAQTATDTFRDLDQGMRRLMEALPGAREGNGKPTVADIATGLIPGGQAVANGVRAAADLIGPPALPPQQQETGEERDARQRRERQDRREGRRAGPADATVDAEIPPPPPAPPPPPELPGPPISLPLQDAPPKPEGPGLLRRLLGVNPAGASELPPDFQAEDLPGRVGRPDRPELHEPVELTSESTPAELSEPDALPPLPIAPPPEAPERPEPALPHPVDETIEQPPPLVNLPAPDRIAPEQSPAPPPRAAAHEAASLPLPEAEVLRSVPVQPPPSLPPREGGEARAGYTGEYTLRGEVSRAVAEALGEIERAGQAGAGGAGGAGGRGADGVAVAGRDGSRGADGRVVVLPAGASDEPAGEDPLPHPADSAPVFPTRSADVPVSGNENGHNTHSAAGSRTAHPVANDRIDLLSPPREAGSAHGAEIEQDQVRLGRVGGAGGHGAEPQRREGVSALDQHASGEVGSGFDQLPAGAVSREQDKAGSQFDQAPVAAVSHVSLPVASAALGDVDSNAGSAPARPVVSNRIALIPRLPEGQQDQPASAADVQRARGLVGREQGEGELGRLPGGTEPVVGRDEHPTLPIVVDSDRARRQVEQGSPTLPIRQQQQPAEAHGLDAGVQAGGLVRPEQPEGELGARRQPAAGAVDNRGQQPAPAVLVDGDRGGRQVQHRQDAPVLPSAARPEVAQHVLEGGSELVQVGRRDPLGNVDLEVEAPLHVRAGAAPAAGHAGDSPAPVVGGATGLQAHVVANPPLAAEGLDRRGGEGGVGGGVVRHASSPSPVLAQRPRDSAQQPAEIGGHPVLGNEQVELERGSRLDTDRGQLERRVDAAGGRGVVAAPDSQVRPVDQRPAGAASSGDRGTQGAAPLAAGLGDRRPEAAHGAAAALPGGSAPESGGSSAVSVLPGRDLDAAPRLQALNGLVESRPVSAPRGVDERPADRTVVEIPHARSPDSPATIAAPRNAGFADRMRRLLGVAPRTIEGGWLPGPGDQTPEGWVRPETLDRLSRQSAIAWESPPEAPAASPVVAPRPHEAATSPAGETPAREAILSSPATPATPQQRRRRRETGVYERPAYANPALLPRRAFGHDQAPTGEAPAPRMTTVTMQQPDGTQFQVRRPEIPDLSGGLPTGSAQPAAERGTFHGAPAGWVGGRHAAPQTSRWAERRRAQANGGDGYASAEQTEQGAMGGVRQLGMPQTGGSTGRRREVAAGLRAQAVDISQGRGDNSAPSLPGGHSLGSLSARHESGGRGAAAIGNDSTGGWSYGTYQLASGRGSVAPFLASLRESNPELAAKLDAAGGDQAARAGSPEFRAAWQQAARDPTFAAAQHDHIKQTHYDPLARTSERLGLGLENRTAGLRDVMWSTAVQHGPGSLRELGARNDSGAADVVQDALRSLGARDPEAVGKLTDEQITEAIYQQRRSRFGNSTPNEQASVTRRFDQEGPQALARIAQERRDGASLRAASASLGDSPEGISGPALPPAPAEREAPPQLAQREAAPAPADGIPPDPAASPGRTSAPAVGSGGGRPDAPSLTASAPGLAVADPVMPWNTRNAVVAPTPTDGGMSMGTPLPAAERNGAQAAERARHEISGTFQVAPLEVRHTNAATGEVTGVDYQPVTQMGAPRAWGMPTR